MDVDILATIGLTFIVTQSYIFKGVRLSFQKVNPHLGYLIKCPLCFGFWAFFMVLILKKINCDFINHAFIASFCCYTIWLLLQFFIKKYD